MPLVSSDYKPSFWFKNSHFSTIYPSVFRKVTGVHQQRELLTLPDGDFLALDWSYSSEKSQQLVILLHGLEGDAQRPYMLGAAKNFVTHQFDVCAVNFRSCSGKPNKQYRSYHSGATDDLESIIKHVLTLNQYQHLFLMGFSLGGNLLLKYLGENTSLPKQLKASVAVSVPCDLKDTCDQLLQPKNAIYAARFKKHLMAKLKVKQQQFPDNISLDTLKNIKTLKDFDDAYTAPAHGFKDALDYYSQCSANKFLPR